MNFLSLDIEGPLVIEPRVFKDNRGYFYESYNKEVFEKAGLSLDFVQDNQSLSQKGILRGLHFQSPPFEQGKLVRVIQGAVLDVIVDIRKHSLTYGRTFSIVLTGENFTQLWIPAGFAHGFLTLEDNTIFSYKCTGFYNKNAEGGIMWNDPDLNIDWQGVKDPVLSEKDKQNTAFRNFISPF